MTTVTSSIFMGPMTRVGLMLKKPACHIIAGLNWLALAQGQSKIFSLSTLKT